MGDQKTLLDFALTMATLSIVYSLSCVVLGPWIGYRPLLWAALAILGCLLATLFYNLAISAAANYGDFLRAAFDLHRLKLMQALERPRPISIVSERKQWRELSKLAVYADPADFDLRAESGSSDSESPEPSEANSEAGPVGKRDGTTAKSGADATKPPSDAGTEPKD